MKIAVLSAFPLVDNHYYKKVFLHGLSARSKNISEAILVYAHTQIRNYFQQASRNFGWRESLKRLKGNKLPGAQEIKRHPAENTLSRGNVARVAKSLGIEVKKYRRFNDDDCLRLLRQYRPDVIHNLCGAYIPRVILDIPEHGVFSGHYGLLPLIRGGDTIRWTILLNVPLVVSHMVLAPALDMGDIIRKEAVVVNKGDTIAELRYKCQIINAKGHLELLDQLSAGTITRTPQKERQGTTFYRMGRTLRRKVDLILAANEYNHYGSSVSCQS